MHRHQRPPFKKFGQRTVQTAHTPTLLQPLCSRPPLARVATARHRLSALRGRATGEGREGEGRRGRETRKRRHSAAGRETRNRREAVAGGDKGSAAARAWRRGERIDDVVSTPDRRIRVWYRRRTAPCPKADRPPSNV